MLRLEPSSAADCRGDSQPLPVLLALNDDGKTAIPGCHRDFTVIVAAITKFIKPSIIKYLNGLLIQSPYLPWGRYYLWQRNGDSEAKGSVFSGSLWVSSEAGIEPKSTGFHGPCCVLLS